MRKKLTIIAALLVAANLLIVGGIVENSGKLKRPVHCQYNIELEYKVCQ